MAAAEMAKRLAQRATEAEQLINILKSQIASIRSVKNARLIREEEERLKSENEQYRQEVESLKNRLIQLEYRNGTRSVSNETRRTVPVPHEKSEAKVIEPRDVQITAAGSADVEQVKPPSQKKTKEKKSQSNQKKGNEDDAPVDISRLDLRVGKIVSVKKHPDADSLYVEQVDVGEEQTRTVVSGLVKFIPIEQMENRLAVLLCNLKPAKMRGVVSQAMVMCASNPEKIEILDPPADSVPGELIRFAGYGCGKADAQLNPKKKIWEQVAPDLKTDDNKVATYKGIAFDVEGKGVVKSQTLANTVIK